MQYVLLLPLLLHARPSTDRTHRHPPHTTLPTTDKMKKHLKNFLDFGTNEYFSSQEKKKKKEQMKQAANSTRPKNPAPAEAQGKAPPQRSSSSSSLRGTMLPAPAAHAFPPMPENDPDSATESSSEPSSPETSTVESEEDQDPKELKALRKAAKERKKDKKRAQKKKRKAKLKAAKASKKQRIAQQPLVQAVTNADVSKDTIVYGSTGTYHTNYLTICHWYHGVGVWEVHACLLSCVGPIGFVWGQVRQVQGQLCTSRLFISDSH
jgi:DNA mismatch repair ATPase MutL